MTIADDVARIRASAQENAQIYHRCNGREPIVPMVFMGLDKSLAECERFSTSNEQLEHQLQALTVTMKGNPDVLFPAFFAALAPERRAQGAALLRMPIVALGGDLVDYLAEGVLPHWVVPSEGHTARD